MGSWPEHVAAWYAILALIVVAVLWEIYVFAPRDLTVAEILGVMGLGLLTLIRVTVLIDERGQERQAVVRHR